MHGHCAVRTSTETCASEIKKGRHHWFLSISTPLSSPTEVGLGTRSTRADSWREIPFAFARVCKREVNAVQDLLRPDQPERRCCVSVPRESGPSGPAYWPACR